MAARRLKLATWFFRIGARVAGCQIQINDDPVRALQKSGHWAAADFLERRRVEKVNGNG